MRLWRYFLAAALLVPCPAPAQTTADAIAAIARADYAAAVRILRPLAERVTEPDPLAASSWARCSTRAAA